MPVLGSMVVLPPPGPLFFVSLAVLLLAGLALWFGFECTGNQEAVRRLAVVNHRLGIGGCLFLQGWAIWSAIECLRRQREFPDGVVSLLRVLDYPLHASAAGFAWHLCAGLLALCMRCRLRRETAGVALCAGLLIALSLLPLLAPPSDGYGFRTHGEDRVEDEAKGIYGGDTWSGLMEMHPEVFLMSRWRLPLEGVVPGLGVLAGYALLRGSRRVREGLPHLEAPLPASTLSLLLLGTAMLWVQTRALCVAQAAMWASSRTPQGDVEKVLSRETAVPAAAAILGLALVVALRIRRPEEGAQPPLR